MPVVKTFMLIFLIMLFCSALQAQSWETHLNLREVDNLVNNRSLSLLLKKKTGENTYFRLGLNGYFNSTSTTNTIGNTAAFSIGLSPGIEKRIALSEKLFLLKGVDFIYQTGATLQYPRTATDFSYQLHSNAFGLSPFIGLHYVISPHFAFLMEIHLEVVGTWNKGTYKNQTSLPDRTDKLTSWDINFLPFKYLTIAYTF